jgi:pimeloyl-ACP methyl ester carboxylesterase
MTLHVHARGEGMPVLVLPSFGLDHNAMAEVVEPAFEVASGWSRLYIDLPGTGASPPGEPRSDAVLNEVAETLGSVLGNQRCIAVGWSYGGYLAAGLARRVPRQVGGLLMACTGFKIRPEDRNLAGVTHSVAEPDWLDDVPASLHDHFVRAVGCQTAAVANRIASVLARNGPVDEAYLADLRANGYALSDEDAPTPCNGPVCILTGRRDRVIGYVDMFGALDRYEHADYLAIGNAGHYLPLEQPRLFTAAVQSWLAECQLLLRDAQD